MITSLTSDLCYPSAIDTLALCNTKSLSPIELLQEQITCTERTEDTIIAFSNPCFDTAMDAARASECRYAKGAPVGALDGLTLAAKANAIAGFPAEYASLVHQGKVSCETDLIIDDV